MNNISINRVDLAKQNRFRNSIQNAESDSKANIKSDHYPVIARVQIKLKANKQNKGQGRKRYLESTNEQKEQHRIRRPKPNGGRDSRDRSSKAKETIM